MGSESGLSIYFSIVCDLAIAASKFIAAVFTGSAAMLSEGVHSVVDSCNGVLLLWGKRASGKAADADHPFGYGMELYFWTFVVTVLIFGMGGGVSIYEGVQRVLHVSPMQDPKWNYAVLAFSAVFEGATIRVAMREFRKANKQGGFWRAFRVTKDLTVMTVLLENAAALVGLVIAFAGIFLGNLLHMPRLDGVASILVGVTLAAVAVVLATETKGLLIGEGASKEVLQNIRQIAEHEAGVVRAGAPLTMYFGPQSVLLALDVEFDRRLSATEVTSVVDRLEKSIRNQYPKIQRIFIEAESLSKAGQER